MIFKLKSAEVSVASTHLCKIIANVHIAMALILTFLLYQNM